MLVWFMIFVKNVLKIEDPENSIMTDRAHRIGYRSVGKTRPIVAKLVRTKDKELIKHASKVADLRSSDFRAADQFPQEVHVLARRKELIPKMADARKNGNKAVLVRDKQKLNRGSEKCLNCLLFPEMFKDSVLISMTLII